MGACFYLIGSKNFNSGLNGAYKAVRRASTSFSIAAKLASISEALVESLSSLQRKYWFKVMQKSHANYLMIICNLFTFRWHYLFPNQFVQEFQVFLTDQRSTFQLSHPPQVQTQFRNLQIHLFLPCLLRQNRLKLVNM